MNFALLTRRPATAPGASADGRAHRSRLAALMGFTLAVLLAAACDARAQVVIISLPSAVGFTVNNVGQVTPGSPATTRASFVVVNLAFPRVLRVSVKADGNFTPPGGPAIPASAVSWVTSNATGVVGTNGTLSTASYNTVFQMQSLVTAGGIDVAWALAGPGGGIRAGTHTVLVRWRLEAVVP